MGANRQVLEWLALVNIAGAFNLGPALVKIAGAFDENGQVLEWLVDADRLSSIGLPAHTQLSEAYKPLRRRRLLPLPLSDVSLGRPTLRGVFDAMSFSDQAGSLVRPHCGDNERAVVR